MNVPDRYGVVFRFSFCLIWKVSCSPFALYAGSGWDPFTGHGACTLLDSYHDVTSLFIWISPISFLCVFQFVSAYPMSDTTKNKHLSDEVRALLRAKFRSDVLTFETPLNAENLKPKSDAFACFLLDLSDEYLSVTVANVSRSESFILAEGEKKIEEKTDTRMPTHTSLPIDTDRNLQGLLPHRCLSLTRRITPLGTYYALAYCKIDM